LSTKEQRLELEDQLRHDGGMMFLLKQERYTYLSKKSPVNLEEFHTKLQGYLTELMNLREMDKCGRVIHPVVPRSVLGLRQPAP
jgi:hypothetical protein